MQNSTLRYHFCRSIGSCWLRAHIPKQRLIMGAYGTLYVSFMALLIVDRRQVLFFFYITLSLFSGQKIPRLRLLRDLKSWFFWEWVSMPGNSHERYIAYVLCQKHETHSANNCFVCTDIMIELTIDFCVEHQ